MGNDFQSRDRRNQGGSFRNDKNGRNDRNDRGHWNDKNLPEASFDEHCPKYRKADYHDKDQRLEFIVGYPKTIAEMLSDRGKYKIKDTENNSTQIRKYYEVVRNIETLIKLDRISIDEALIEVNRLRALAENARSGGKVTNCFVDFLNINLDKIKTKEDLIFFAKHFEAVIGYFKKDSKGGNRK